MLNLNGGSDDFQRLNREALKEVRGRQARVAARPQTVTAGQRFASELEAEAWQKWIPTTGAVQAFYEPLTFHLSFDSRAKLRDYTPDFWLLFADGSLWIVEVKGSFKAQGSGRSSKQNLHHAAVEFAWLARWFALLPQGARRVNERLVVADWKLIEFTGEGKPPSKEVAT